MEIFLVSSGAYSDYRIDNIFSTRELAEAYCKPSWDAEWEEALENASDEYWENWLKRAVHPDTPEHYVQAYKKQAKESKKFFREIVKNGREFYFTQYPSDTRVEEYEVLDYLPGTA